MRQERKRTRVADRPWTRGLAVVALTGVLLVAPTVAAEGDTASPLAGLTSADLQVHLEAFQAIADANGGNRSFDTPGYAASVDYVVARLEQAGLRPEIHEVVVPDAPIEVAPPVLDRVAPTAHTYVEGTDYDQPVPGPPVPAEGDVRVVEDGCDPDSWDGVPEGAVALVTLSADCPANVQHIEAYAKGVAGVLFGPAGGVGEPPAHLDLGRQQLYFTLPTMAISGDVAAELATLAESATVTMRIDTGFSTGPVTTTNVIAELPGTTDEVVTVGAHLDSVLEGPGINDNGSGAAGVLALAERLAAADLTTQRTIRFAWWGAEESGILGSKAYVDSLAPAELARIRAYLNVDMIGSPNFKRAVTDPAVAGDDATVSPGSDAITDLFQAYFASRGEPTVTGWWGGNSDDYAFALAGIPTGGLFTGATEIKTEAEAALFGGTVGQPLDPCYHQACDTLANTNVDMATEMTRALGTVALQLAVVVDAPAPGPVEVPAKVVPRFTG